jgi:hypothetical protein
MIPKTKGRDRWHGATPKTHDSQDHTRNDQTIGDSYSSRIKTLIVRLALAGWLPFSLADFLIHRGGLRHV